MFFSNINFLFHLTIDNLKEYFKKSESIKSDKITKNSVNWFGHATTVINLCDKIIVTDPVFSSSLGYFKRIVKKPTYIKDLKNRLYTFIPWPYGSFEFSITS